MYRTTRLRDCVRIEWSVSALLTRPRTCTSEIQTPQPPIQISRITVGSLHNETPVLITIDIIDTRYNLQLCAVPFAMLSLNPESPVDG